MPIVTFGWGGKGWYDPATGKTTPLTNAPVVPAYPPQDRGTFTIVQPTNAPMPVAQNDIAHRLALATAPQVAPAPMSEKEKTRAWVMSQWGFDDNEAAWFIGEKPVMPDSLKQFYPEGE